MNYSKIFQLVSFAMLTLVSNGVRSDTLTLSLQDTGIRDAMLMLSKQQRLNIFVAEGVTGKVSVNLYNMETIDAIHSIAESAGFAVEQRNNSIFIIKRDDAGKYRNSNLTQVRTYKVQYTSPAEIEPILKEHLSNYGSIKMLKENNLLVIEDLPPFLEKIETLLTQIDRQPKQILIEAKILEITLTDNQSFGLDWSKLFDSTDASGSFGTQGLANLATPGLFAQYSNQNVNVALNALKERGRLRTLSTPKLLAMEDRQAETVVGTRIGFKVTTTVNQVTTESIEFLETGIILKVTPSVDRSGRILLDIHPEVSAGSVSDDGIPSKTTTQVSTRMLVPDGKTVFMSGLIRRSINNSKEGVPGLGDIPFIGSLFANDSKNVSTTEIVVLITPKIVNLNQSDIDPQHFRKVEVIDRLLLDEQMQMEAIMKKILDEEQPDDKKSDDNLFLIDDH